MSENNTPNSQEQRPVTNAEARAKWSIDVNVDPYTLPLDQLNPAHPSLFGHDKFWPYFERLSNIQPQFSRTDLARDARADPFVVAGFKWPPRLHGIGDLRAFRRPAAAKTVATAIGWLIYGDATKSLRRWSQTSLHAARCNRVWHEPLAIF